ncbi:MAG: hypothetical protein AAFR87_27460 [Bacteroidota bacterium]
MPDALAEQALHESFFEGLGFADLLLDELYLLVYGAEDFGDFALFGEGGK